MSMTKLLLPMKLCRLSTSHVTSHVLGRLHGFFQQWNLVSYRDIGDGDASNRRPDSHHYIYKLWKYNIYPPSNLVSKLSVYPSSSYDLALTPCRQLPILFLKRIMLRTLEPAYKRLVALSGGLFRVGGIGTIG